MILRNISVLLVPSVFGASAALCQYWSQPAPIRLHPVAVATLEKQERAQAKATARIDLSSSGAGLVDPADNLEPAGSENVPNYVKAFASRPGAPGAFAHVVRTFLYGGLVQPEVKLGMALRVAQLNSNPYLAAHASVCCVRPTMASPSSPQSQRTRQPPSHRTEISPQVRG